MRYQYPLKEPYREGTKYGVKGSMWSCGWHSGQDFYSMSAGGDGKIYPVAEGKVIKVSTTGSYGNSVRVEHGDGYISLYAHMSKINVKQGQEVKEGTVLGIEGSTGNSTARHLHIEIHKGAYSYPSKIDPLKFLKERVEEVEVKKLVINIDGKDKTVEAINHEGTNYVKLRDIVPALGFTGSNIDYDATNKKITVHRG